MSRQDAIKAANPSLPSGKRAWLRPTIEAAAARQAEAFGGPPGGVDYGIYS